MKLKKMYVLIAVTGILIVFGVGGYLAFQVFSSPTQKPPASPGFSQDPQELPEGDQLQDTPLSRTQEVIMNVPSQDASPEAFQRYRANIEYNAVVADKVTITDCTPDPMVLKVKEGTKFMLENRDIKEHTIMVNESHRYLLNPKETIEVTADFGSGLGIYTYMCDDPGLPVGVFLVRETL